MSPDRRALAAVVVVLAAAVAGCSLPSDPDRSYDHPVRVDNADDRPRSGTIRITDDLTGEVVFETTVTVAPNESRSVFNFESVADTESGRFAVRLDPDDGEPSTVTVPMTDCLGEVLVTFEPDEAGLTYSIC